MLVGERAASRTAVLVCQGRAAADGRLAVEAFADPIATEVLREGERAVVDAVRAGAVPGNWKERIAYESVASCATVVVPRTVAIDAAIRAHPHPQLVILGAGLDARPWRMSELADVDVTEIDHPASQRDKQERIGARASLARTHRFQPADLATASLDDALESTGHDPDAPTTWLWEGVVPYLHRADVERTLATVAARSMRGSTLIVSYQTPSVRARAGRVVAGVTARLGGVPTITAGEPWHTLLSSGAMARLLTDAGFGVQTDEDLLAIAERIGTPTEQATSLRNGRIAVAVRH